MRIDDRLACPQPTTVNSFEVSMTLYAGRAVARLWNRSEHPESALEDLSIPRHVRFVWCQVSAIGLGDGVPSSKP
jgi:hypothetical protein